MSVKPDAQDTASGPADVHSYHDRPSPTHPAPASARHRGTSCGSLFARVESGTGGRPPCSGTRAPKRPALIGAEAVPQRMAVRVGTAQRPTLIGTCIALVTAHPAICAGVQRPAGSRPGRRRPVARLAPQLLTRHGR